MRIRFPAWSAVRFIGRVVYAQRGHDAGCGESEVSSPIAHTLITVPILPIMVFVAETCVVTISTVRTIFITRGMKELAALLGFFEVSIWLFAIAQVMRHLTSLDCYVAFAGGFSLGNFLGVFIERRLALGTVAVQITTQKDALKLLRALQAAQYEATAVEARRAVCQVSVISTAIRRKALSDAVSIIRRFDPEAVYSVSDMQVDVEAGCLSVLKPFTRFVRTRGRQACSVLVRRIALRDEEPTVRGAPDIEPRQMAA
jgi:uncharacterized protein YebE (UPF0316 family)